MQRSEVVAALQLARTVVRADVQLPARSANRPRRLPLEQANRQTCSLSERASGRGHGPVPQ